MKFKIISVLFLFSCFVYGQAGLCYTDIMNRKEINAENKIENYLQYDFSDLWLQTDNEFIYGIIGDDYQRIYIKFLSVSKNPSKPNEYYVYGKSMVEDNVCEFEGKISVTKIQEVENQHFGVDDEYKGKSDKQGLLTAEYEFYKNKQQSHSGVFRGKLQTKWYLTDGTLKYNNIDSVSDGYFNNAYTGIWKMYDSKLEKICNWGDYRVPNVSCDFDIGVAEFNVNEKYWGKGWIDFVLNKMIPPRPVAPSESEETVKQWWD